MIKDGVKIYDNYEVEIKLNRFIDLIYKLSNIDETPCFRSVSIINNSEFGKEGGHYVEDFQIVRYRKFKTKTLLQGDSISTVNHWRDLEFPFSELDKRIRSIENRIDYILNGGKND